MAVHRVVLQSQGTEPIFEAHGASSGATVTLNLQQGPKAMELVAMGLAGCMASVTMSILFKKRIAFESIRVEVESDRNDEDPHEFRAVTLKVHIQGAGASLAELQKVVDLASKHCPAHATLAHGVPITAVAVTA